jgi:hypothetical protein
MKLMRVKDDKKKKIKYGGRREMNSRKDKSTEICVDHCIQGIISRNKFH